MELVIITGALDPVDHPVADRQTRATSTTGGTGGLGASGGSASTNSGGASTTAGGSSNSGGAGGNTGTGGGTSTGGTGQLGLERQWTEQASPVTADLMSLATNGEIIVAAGSGVLIYSEDGVTWQEPVQPVSAERVAFGNSLFVAAGEGETAFSSDGRTWTLGTAKPTSPPTITYGSGRFLLMAYLATDGAYAYSMDGDTWTSTMAEPPSIREAFTNIQQSASAGDLLLASRSTVVAGGNFISRDGVTWTLQEDWVGVTYDLAFGNGTYCASAASGQFHTSQDGDTWGTVTAGDGNSMWGITHWDGVFYAVGGFGTMLASPNCSVWGQASDPPQPSEQPNGQGLTLAAIRLHKDRLVVVGDAGTILTSP